MIHVIDVVINYGLQDFKKRYVGFNGKSCNLVNLDKLKGAVVTKLSIDLLKKTATIHLLDNKEDLI